MPTKSIKQLLNLLDSVAEGIFCVDVAGKCTYCNSRCVEILGFASAVDLLGNDMHELIQHHRRDGSEYPLSKCKIYRAFDEGISAHVRDEVFFRNDGQPFDVEFRSHPLHEHDEISGAVVTFSDISLQRAEASYRTQLARMVESSQDAIIGRDLAGKITSWNQGAVRVYGYESEEVLDLTVGDLILPPELQREEQEILHAMANGEELTQFEVRRRRKNGETIDISLTISPVFNADEQLTGFASIERDITEFRKSQDAILRAMNAAEHAEEMASKANRSRADFLANVSHELRTPMNAILGMLNLALEEKLESTVADFLTVARTSAISLLELVNELLDFAKIESGNFEIYNEEFDLRETINQSAKTLAARASEKGLELLCEVDSDVAVKVIGDGRRLGQVLTNLLSNACKFTEKGEVVVEVDIIRQLPNESRLRFAVRDTGIGIAPEVQRNILLPFQQADMSSTRQKQGTGLGLSICRELVSLMGGKLNLESRLGEGSKFWFDLSLPVADRSTPADQLPSELVKDLKVLIVDDNPTNLRILEKTFVSWSMQPIVTGDAEQALRVVDELGDSQRDVSIILVDCLMPRIDGFELAEQLIRKKGEHCPPIVMMQSASDLALYSDRKATAPVTRYVTKPVSQSELLDAVVGVLDLYAEPSGNDDLLPGKDSQASALVKPLRILLVEDLPANQQVAKAILEKRGHTVSLANNGRKAIELLSDDSEVFDVLLMDVQMPVMDGLQATAAVRSMSDPNISSVPIIAMTAHAMRGDREACLAAGMDAYLSKPLDARQLVQLTESIVENPGPKETCAVQKSIDQSIASGETNSTIQSEQNDVRFQLIDMESSLARLGDDRALLLELVDIFLSDAPEILQQLNQSIDNEDHLQLEKSAHALKGLMLNFGAKPCCDLALTLELAGRNENIDSIRSDISKLNELYSQLCTELKSIQCS